MPDIAITQEGQPNWGLFMKIYAQTRVVLITFLENDIYTVAVSFFLCKNYLEFQAEISTVKL